MDPLPSPVDRGHGGGAAPGELGGGAGAPQRGGRGDPRGDPLQSEEHRGAEAAEP